MTTPDPNDYARHLVADLCAVAGHAAAVDWLIAVELAAPEVSAQDTALTLARALHVVFAECLSRPVPPHPAGGVPMTEPERPKPKPPAHHHLPVLTGTGTH